MSFKSTIVKYLFPMEYKKIIEENEKEKEKEKYNLFTNGIDKARVLDITFTRNKEVKRVVNEYLNGFEIELNYDFNEINIYKINSLIRSVYNNADLNSARLGYSSDISSTVFHLKSTEESIRYIFDLIRDYYMEYVNFFLPYNKDSSDASLKMASILKAANEKQREYFAMEEERALKLKEDSVSEFREELEKHLAVLSRKRRSLQYMDDYGFLVDDDWVKEKRKFLRNFKLPTFWLYHYIDDALPIIEYELDRNYLSTDVRLERISFDENMDPYDYEAMCSDMIKEQGWISSVTKGSGDQGVDVVAQKDDIKLAIQCKRFNQPVGNFAVQEVFAGARYYEANFSIVVTNNTFTPSARKLASKLNVFLLHHEDLHNINEILCNRVNYNPIDG